MTCKLEGRGEVDEHSKPFWKGPLTEQEPSTSPLLAARLVRAAIPSAFVVCSPNHFWQGKTARHAEINYLDTRKTAETGDSANINVTNQPFR